MFRLSVFSMGEVNKEIVYNIKPRLMAILNNPKILAISRLWGLLYLFIRIHKLPEPTHQNVRWANTHILIDLRDKFFSCEKNKGRSRALWTIWNWFIIIYDYDPYYRFRINRVLVWLFEKFQLGQWEIETKKGIFERRDLWQE